ncbi:hypothetical protein RA28_10815 [Ruegeria sp. ANG-S4]|nr:hypothetical protein RA28_10815 [Ruegeria sp. ANG-S4]
MINVALSLLCAYFFEFRSPQLTFGIALAFFCVAPTLFGAKTAIVTALLNWIARKKLRQMILVDVQRAKMPTGDQYDYFDADEYLIQVAKDRSVPTKTRMKATEFAATLAAFRQTEWVFATFLQAALNGAIRDHFVINTAPSVTSEDSAN